MLLEDFLNNPTVFQTDVSNSGTIAEGNRTVADTPLQYNEQQLRLTQQALRPLQLAWGSGNVTGAQGYTPDALTAILYSTNVTRESKIRNKFKVEITVDKYTMAHTWRPGNAPFYFKYNAVKIREEMYRKHLSEDYTLPVFPTGHRSPLEFTLPGNLEISSEALVAYETELYDKLTKLYTTKCPKKFKININGTTATLPRNTYQVGSGEDQCVLTKKTTNYSIIVAGSNDLYCAPVLTVFCDHYSTVNNANRTQFNHQVQPYFSGLSCNINDTLFNATERANEHADIAHLHLPVGETKKRKTAGQWRGPYYGLRHCLVNKKQLFRLHMTYGLQGAVPAPIGYAGSVSPPQLPLTVAGFLEIERPVIDIKPIIMGHLELLRMGPAPTGIHYAQTLSDLLVPSMTEAIISLDSSSLVGVTEGYENGELCRGICATKEVNTSLEAGLYLVRRISLCSQGHDPGRSEYNEGFGAICNERITLMTLLSQLTIKQDELRSTSVALGGINPSEFNYGMMSSMDRL